MIQRIFTTTILILAFGLALPACQNRFTASQAGVDANDVPSRPYDVGVDRVVLRIRPGITGSHYIEILNYGTQRDTYTITAPTPHSQRGWITLTQPLPLTVTLDPDQRFQLPITFTVPMTASTGMRDELRIKVENHAPYYVFDYGTFGVNVDPDAPTAGG